MEYLGIAADEPKRFGQLNERKRAPLVEFGIEEGLCGLYCQYNGLLPCYKPTAIAVIASWGGGWEHVSVSLARRCPTWEEMCMVKDIFWGEDECVVQFHPPRSEYVNRHPYCLHLWKKIGEEYETPPKEYVG